MWDIRVFSYDLKNLKSFNIKWLSPKTEYFRSSVRLLLLSNLEVLRSKAGWAVASTYWE